MSTSLSTLVDARVIVQQQDERTVLWHGTLPEPDVMMNPEPQDPSFPSLVESLHHANFTLWHAEDEARLPCAADSAIAAVKRRIDVVNQERNNTTERLDACLLANLESLREQPRMQQAEQHSETPGMMIDRLSILSLKLFHTQLEMERNDAPSGHRERNTKRWATLQEQRDDLALCLSRLWTQVCAGERYFKQYRQLKMYNDPELNPILYRAKTKDTGTQS